MTSVTSHGFPLKVTRECDKLRGMAYTPLDETLLKSTLLKEGPDVVATWTLILASRDRFGETDLTPAFVASALRIPDERAETAWEVLASPDPKSRNKAEGGRRIVPTEDGNRWRIVSAEKYQYRASKEAAAERQRRHRAKSKEKHCAICGLPAAVGMAGNYLCDEHAPKQMVAREPVPEEPEV